MNSKAGIIKVAFADDHNAVREGIISSLEGSKIIKFVLEAKNGQELLDKLLRSNELPDICLIDLSMPVMNGYSLLKEIRKRWPAMPCIILSAFAHEHQVIEMIKAGANGYLLKSCTSEELVAAISEVADHGYYYNEMMNEGSILKALKPTFRIKPIVLNVREIEFMKHACSDLSYADIAIKMGTSFKTIDGIRERLFDKLNLSSRVGLVLAAVKLGYYTVESDMGTFAEVKRENNNH